jgi:Cu/Zn superoxide dismutase
MADRRPALLLLLLLLLLAATARGPRAQQLAEAPFPITAVVSLDVGVKGVSGSVQLMQVDPETLEIQYNINGLPPAGPHGLHVHSSADFSDGCASTGRRLSKRGTGNLVADKDGVARGTLTDTASKLYGEASILGLAMVLHEGGELDGHEGGRLACGEVLDLKSPEGMAAKKKLQREAMAAYFKREGL